MHLTACSERVENRPRVCPRANKIIAGFRLRLAFILTWGKDMHFLLTLDFWKSPILTQKPDSWVTQLFSAKLPLPQVAETGASFRLRPESGPVLILS